MAPLFSKYIQLAPLFLFVSWIILYFCHLQSRRSQRWCMALKTMLCLWWNVSCVYTTGNHERWCGAHWLHASCMIMFGAKRSIALISHYLSSWTVAILIGSCYNRENSSETRECHQPPVPQEMHDNLCGFTKKASKCPLFVICSVTNMSAASCIFPRLPSPLLMISVYIGSVQYE